MTGNDSRSASSSRRFALSEPSAAQMSAARPFVWADPGTPPTAPFTALERKPELTRIGPPKIRRTQSKRHPSLRRFEIDSQSGTLSRPVPVRVSSRNVKNSGDGVVRVITFKAERPGIYVLEF